MPEKKNALAELAKRLRNGLYINPNDKRFNGPVIVSTLDANDVLEAQRIVAELARMNPDQFACGCFRNLIDECRSIAEKVASDGK